MIHHASRAPVMAKCHSVASGWPATDSTHQIYLPDDDAFAVLYRGMPNLRSQGRRPVGDDHLVVVKPAAPHSARSKGAQDVTNCPKEVTRRLKPFEALCVVL